MVGIDPLPCMNDSNDTQQIFEKPPTIKCNSPLRRPSATTRLVSVQLRYTWVRLSISSVGQFQCWSTWWPLFAVGGTPMVMIVDGYTDMAVGIQHYPSVYISKVNRTVMRCSLTHESWDFCYRPSIYRNHGLRWQTHHVYFHRMIYLSWLFTATSVWRRILIFANIYVFFFGCWMYVYFCCILQNIEELLNLRNTSTPKNNSLTSAIFPMNFWATSTSFIKHWDTTWYNQHGS